MGPLVVRRVPRLPVGLSPVFSGRRQGNGGGQNRYLLTVVGVVGRYRGRGVLDVALRRVRMPWPGGGPGLLHGGFPVPRALA